MIKSIAPVLIPTLNRYDHFKRCVNSLKECELSLHTDLFIALDYPLKDSHWDGYNKILKFIGKIEGFKTINIIKREVNFGASKNGSDALNFIFSKYETLVFSEDDNVFSKDFLMFMNRCLETYYDDNRIFSVCGYNYPVEISRFHEHEMYIWQGYSAWGVGLWREKFQKIDLGEEIVQLNVEDFLKNYIKVIQLDKIANHYIPALLHMHNVHQVHGDTYISMYQFLNNMYSVFPVISRVRNMGHDGSGVNCVVVDKVFSAQEIYSGSGNYETPKILKADEVIDKILYDYFKTQLKSKIKLFIKLILFKLGFNWSKK
jgi:hypothetical protein